MGGGKELWQRPQTHPLLVTGPCRGFGLAAPGNNQLGSGGHNKLAAPLVAPVSPHPICLLAGP